MPDTTKLPDQPDGIDEQTHDLPDPARATDRVRDYIAETGDGLYDVQGGKPLYGRDLEAVIRDRNRLALRLDETQVDATAYRDLADALQATMTDPDRWDGDEAEIAIMLRYVQHLAANTAHSQDARS